MAAIRIRQSTCFGAKCFPVAALSGILLAQAGPGKTQQEQSGASVPQPAASSAAAIYPDSAGGLKQLATDIVKAQEKTDFTRAGQLLDTLVLPDFERWYSENFSEAAAARAIPLYAASKASLPTQLADVFLNTHLEGFRNIEAVRYEDLQSACPSPQIFGAITFRRSRVPLYELRFIHGDKFKHVFAFAHVDGAFRLVLIPDFSSRTIAAPERAGDAKPQADAVDRVRMGGAVSAAQLVCKVQPYYPVEARQQHISGTVRLHAIIGRDGNIKQLDLISGPKELAESAKQAVGQWRYRPTTLVGQPVEVDTTIDVIYTLNY